MATTDTRSGFRLPWSSDRSADAPAPEDTVEAAGEAGPDPEEDETATWTPDDINARLGLDSQTHPADPTAAPDAQEPAMIALDPTTQQAPPAPRKPSKLMADLTAAIRATAEAATEQALAQVDADVTKVVETIRSHSKEGEGTLRLRTDEDIAAIKEWSRAEIARIKEETEGKIDARKGALDTELAAHAKAIEQRVGDVEESADAYRAAMASYAESLGREDDPSRLATMAESMPEAPQLEEWTNFEDFPLDLPAAALAVASMKEAEAAQAQLEAETALAEAAAAELEAEAAQAEAAQAQLEAEAAVAAEAQLEAEAAQAEAAQAEAEAAQAEAEAAQAEAEAAEAAIAAEAQVEAEAAPEMGAVEPEAGAQPATPWGDAESAWGGGAARSSAASDAETGDPVDRGAIMAALEAAADAVVAAESAAESANQAEAAADAAESAAELLKVRVDADDELDADAQAALSARMDAGGFAESFSDRLASLLPGHGDGAADAEPRTTQVIVSGLVSVASIASFKRHLGRVAGVQAVAVASGPDGEFVFNVTHRPDVSFRDALPTLPGFAARVTSTGDGVVQVTARDPESEG